VAVVEAGLVPDAATTDYIAGDLTVTIQRESETATMASKRGDARRARQDAGDAEEPRRATLFDVAEAAGVSVSAASKVVRNAYGVSPQMKARVTAAVEQLGYRPHAGARAMRGPSFTIGIVLSELASPFQPEVAQGVGAEFKHGPYVGIIVEGGVTPAQQQRSIEALLDRQVDGLIVVAPWVDVSWLEEVGQSVPMVTVALHGPAQHFDTVVADERLGAQMMVDHLAKLGHRDVVHTSMPPGPVGGPFMLSHTARRRGFEEAMVRNGLDPRVIETQFSEEGGYEATIEALTSERPPTAVFAGADIAALGALRAAVDLELEVPEDLTITGYDNIYVSTIKRVSLTTVDQSGHLTGAAAARAVLERIEGRRTPSQYVLAPRLIIRDTSGRPPSSSQTSARAQLAVVAKNFATTRATGA
jgi:LacI family transcriptional regulator